MATKLVRFCRITADGESTTFHLETSSNIVMRPNNTSVEQTLQKLESGGGTGGSGVSQEAFNKLQEQLADLAVVATKHATSAELEALETKLLAELATKATLSKPVKFVLDQAGWRSDGSAAYPYLYDITEGAENVVEGDDASIIIAPSSIDIAKAAELCPTCETFEGKVRVRCKNNPTGDITGEYRITH